MLSINNIDGKIINKVKEESLIMGIIVENNKCI